MGEQQALGIDLGTTHSAVAILDADGTVRVLADESGHTLVPSVVAVGDEGELLVGRAARERGVGHPRRAVARFKPDMGSGRRFRLGAHDLTPVSLSALVLRHLVGTARDALGADVRRAVISVPAWFGEPERRATLDAATLAGLDVLRLVNEPTAAAIAHGLHADPEPRSVVVLDLGGGTFDVTVLEAFDGILDVQASVGDVHLGGEDATDAVVELLLADAGLAVLDPALRGRVRLRAERAKRRLSREEVVEVRRDELDGGTTELTRERLEQACAPLAARVRRLVRQALVQAGLRSGDVDEVVLVGGASRMPWLSRLAEDLLGRPPRSSDRVDHLVAEGAAVQAALVLDHAAVREQVVTDVLTHSLGVAVVRTWGDQRFADRFDPVLPRGTTLPAARSRRYSTLSHDQESVTLRVYEGEHRVATDNTSLGQVSIEGLPTHDDEDAREDLVVRFAHDASGLLEVHATVDSTGESAHIVVERAGHAYTPEERRTALQALERLTIHPRELLPNRYLLERATWVVEVLAGGARDALDRHVVAFEAALESQDPDRISRWRTALDAHLTEVCARYELELPE